MASSTSDIFVWAWLPGESEPVPAGALRGTPNSLSFRYGDRYLARPNAVSLSPTLPLDGAGSRNGFFDPTEDMALPSAIRDAAPDAWGRRVIMSKLRAGRGFDADTADLDESTYLMHSDSNRIGALDFQRSPSEYRARGQGSNLPDLQQAAELVSRGEELPEQLRAAVNSGTGIGGARPKALITLGGTQSMVKLSVSTDVFPSVESEALASNLAARAGIRTSPVRSEVIGGKYALISDRFDRTPGDASRKMIVSALTLTGRGEMSARYSSYPELISKLRSLSSEPSSVGAEMFDRVAFNMMISNGDDHLRNHAAFWDGEHAELTPAYDLAPGERREGAEMTLTLPFGENGEKLADLELLIQNSHVFSINTSEARERVSHLRYVISTEMDDAADEMLIPSGTLRIFESSFLHDTVTRNLPSATNVGFAPQEGRGKPLSQTRRKDAGKGVTAKGGTGGSYDAHERGKPNDPLG